MHKSDLAKGVLLVLEPFGAFGITLVIVNLNILEQDRTSLYLCVSDLYTLKTPDNA